MVLAFDVPPPRESIREGLKRHSIRKSHNDCQRCKLSKCSLRRIDSPFVWNGKSANELSDAYIPEEEIPMLKKLALASTAVALLMSTASADYYIVQEKATKKCKVVETRPTETTWIQVGPAAFKTQSEADKQIKTVCVEK